MQSLPLNFFNAFAKPEERQRLLPQATRIEGEKVLVNTEIERQQLAAQSGESRRRGTSRLKAAVGRN